MRYYLLVLVLCFATAPAMALEVYAKQIAFESGVPFSLKLANPLDAPIIVQVRVKGVSGKSYPSRVRLYPGQDQYLRILLRDSESGHIQFRYQTPDGNRLGVVLRAVPK